MPRPKGADKKRRNYDLTDSEMAFIEEIRTRHELKTEVEAVRLILARAMSLDEITLYRRDRPGDFSELMFL